MRHRNKFYCNLQQQGKENNVNMKFESNNCIRSCTNSTSKFNINFKFIPSVLTYSAEIFNTVEAKIDICFCIMKNCESLVDRL